jgi:hypothetical protein
MLPTDAIQQTLVADVFAVLTRLSQLNRFSRDFGSFPSDNSIHCNNSLPKTAAVKTYPLSL